MGGDLMRESHPRRGRAGWFAGMKCHQGQLCFTPHPLEKGAASTRTTVLLFVSLGISLMGFGLIAFGVANSSTEIWTPFLLSGAAFSSTLGSALDDIRAAKGQATGSSICKSMGVIGVLLVLLAWQISIGVKWATWSAVEWVTYALGLLLPIFTAFMSTEVQVPHERRDESSQGE